MARCRVRDLDGVTRKVERWGSSRTAAQRALQDELRQRRGERTELLRPYSRFRDAAALRMAKITERREDSTADTYRHWLDGLVLPQFGGLRLHERDVAHMDAFFSRLERARRTIKHEDGTTHRADSVRSEHPAHHPRHRIQDSTAGRTAPGPRLQPGPASSNASSHPRATASPKGHRKAPPRSLTPEERGRLFAFVDAEKVAVGADLPDLIRFALGSGLRIGELCAVRWLDLNLDGIPVVTADDIRLEKLKSGSYGGLRSSQILVRNPTVSSGGTGGGAAGS